MNCYIIELMVNEWLPTTSIYPQLFLLQWIWQQISGGQAWYFLCHVLPVSSVCCYQHMALSRKGIYNIQLRPQFYQL